jgi:hypothetical protein
VSSNHARKRFEDAPDLLRVDFEVLVEASEDGALAGGAIDDDVGGLIVAALADHDVVEVDAGSD